MFDSNLNLLGAGYTYYLILILCMVAILVAYYMYRRKQM